MLLLLSGAAAALIGTNDVDHTTDSALKKAIAKTHNGDSLLVDEFALACTTSAYCVLRFIKAHTCDSYLEQSKVVHTTNAFCSGSVTKSHTTGGYISADRVGLFNIEPVPDMSPPQFE